MKDVFYKYITVYLSIFIAYILLAIHSEFSNLEKDLWLYNEILFYGLVAIVQALVILWLYFIFFGLINYMILFYYWSYI